MKKLNNTGKAEATGLHRCPVSDAISGCANRTCQCGNRMALAISPPRPTTTMPSLSPFSSFIRLLLFHLPSMETRQDKTNRADQSYVVQCRNEKPNKTKERKIRIKKKGESVIVISRKPGVVGSASAGYTAMPVSACVWA